MLKIRMKRDAEQNAAAMKRLTQIETSIVELPNEDPLDLADIFREKSETAIARYALAEMTDAISVFNPFSQCGQCDGFRLVPDIQPVLYASQRWSFVHLARW